MSLPGLDLEAHAGRCASSALATHLLAKASSPRLSRACSSPPSGMRDRRMQGRRVRDGFRLACAFTRLRVATRLVSISRDYLPALLALCMHRRALSAPTRSSEPSQQRPRRRPRRPARLHRFLCNPTWRIRQSTMTRAWHYSMPRARNLDHPTSVMRVLPARCVKAFEPAWPRARSACGPLRLDRARSSFACESIRAPCSSSPHL